MKRLKLSWALFGLLTIGSISAQAQSPEEFSKHADSFFKKYVSDGAVSYSKIKQNIVEVEGLYQEVGKMNLEKANDAAKKAFFINAYNVIVIYWVAKHYPLKSPLDNSGFFDKVKHSVAGESLTLNALEIKKLLNTYKDARVHFTLACAAQSCPPLASFAYTPDALDQQLTERTAKALNNPNWLKVQPGKKTVQASKIFDWYNKDFTGGGKSLIEWINQYKKEKIPANYAVGYYEYDWSLNDKRN